LTRQFRNPSSTTKTASRSKEPDPYISKFDNSPLKRVTYFITVITIPSKMYGIPKLTDVEILKTTKALIMNKIARSMNLMIKGCTISNNDGPT